VLPSPSKELSFQRTFPFNIQTSRIRPTFRPVISSFHSIANLYFPVEIFLFTTCRRMFPFPSLIVPWTAKSLSFSFLFFFLPTSSLDGSLTSLDLFHSSHRVVTITRPNSRLLVQNYDFLYSFRPLWASSPSPTLSVWQWFLTFFVQLRVLIPKSQASLSLYLAFPLCDPRLSGSAWLPLHRLQILLVIRNPIVVFRPLSSGVHPLPATPHVLACCSSSEPL